MEIFGVPHFNSKVDIGLKFLIKLIVFLILSINFFPTKMYLKLSM